MMKKYLLFILLLLFSVAVKVYFISHPSRILFALGFTDITKMASLIDKKPVPLPYLNAYMEYPVLIGFFIWLAGTLTTGREQYFLLTAFALSLLAVLSFYFFIKTAYLEGVKKVVWKYWFLSPTVFLFTVYNWDILAVFFLLASLYFYMKRKDFWGSLFMTLGVWTKLFPIFLLPAVLLQRILQKNFKGAGKILVTFFLVSLLLNLPLALKSFEGWSVFFTFSKNRGPNIDSIWAGLFVMSDKIFGRYFDLKNYYTNIINFVSNLLLITLMGAFYLKAWKEKFDNIITLTLAGVLLFLLTAKVYSPPYNFWILPLAALAALNFKTFLVFDISNALVFWVVFEYFFEVNILGHSALGFPWYKVTYLLVVLRQVVLSFLVLKVWRIIKVEN